MITISVIVCTYNQERTISRTLDAIISQQCDVTFEVIIGEDCSTDNTRAICKDYAEKYSSIIRLMPKAPNKGIVDNYYDCVREAQGEYIMECGGDDEWCQGRIQLCYDTIKSNPNVVQVLTQMYFRKDNTHEITEPDNNLFPFGLIKGADVIDGMMHQKSGQTALYAITRRSAMMDVMHKYPQFFTGRRYLTEDRQLIVLLATIGDFINLPDRTYYYTIDTSSITRGKLTKHLRYNKNMLRLTHDLAKAIGYRGSLLPYYAHSTLTMCKLIMSKTFIKLFPFLHD